MRVNKTKLDDIHRCYAVSSVVVDGETNLVFASEGEGGPCCAYSGPGFSRREIVWQSGGGTMSVVAVPGRENEFLATQNFFPGFKAETAKVVWCKFSGGAWQVHDYLTLPYLHRFDLLAVNGVTHFLGATLCSSKTEREDWRDPGKIFTGVLPDTWATPMAVTSIKEGLTKNHGYWRGEKHGRPVGYITCDSGVWTAAPPGQPGGEWALEKLMDGPISDIGVFDLDGDGEEEYALLAPFHGDSFTIAKRTGTGVETVYRYPKTPELSHAVWTGLLNGSPALVGGYRQADAELFLVRYNPSAGQYETAVLDTGPGPTNVTVVHTPGGDVIASANKQFHEAAIYTISD